MPDFKDHSLSVSSTMPSAERRQSVSSRPPTPLLTPFLSPIMVPSDLKLDLDLLPFLLLQVDHDDLMTGVAVVIEAFFPDWNVDTECKLVQCTNGITNKLVRCDHTPSGLSVLVRTYGKGSGVLIDRDQELVNMIALSQRELSPRLYGRFENGIVYGFTPGQVFTVADMSDPHKSQLVAKHLASWHQVTLPVPRVPRLFQTLWKWLDAVPKIYSRDNKAEKFRNSGITVNKLRSELTQLQSHLEALNSPIVSCHCDLLSGNIVYAPDLDAVNFIDYEYGCYSYRGFDIGNHFCEWAGFDCDWSLYPSEEQQKTWLNTYLTSMSVTDTPPTAEELDQIYRETLKFSLAAHFFWAIWALVQAEISDLDFDYLDYASMRLAEYFRKRDAWLAL
ncbi:kinase-like domain-containing protein [Entophlyctis helioformis]|nr:kinase-like domain-containing protein [Entophlyctis helioformis]